MKRPLLALLLAGVAAAPAPATTLREALAAAYRTNPTLTGARAQQRANDENVPIARSQGLPNLGATTDVQQDVITQNDGGNGALVTGPTRQLRSGLNLSVPLYAGGAVRNGVRAADLRVTAGQDNLRDVEATLFTQVTAAYMDVIRDQAIVSLNQANVRVLQVNLEATRDRFEVGDLTRTDVAQSESRLALAQGQLQSAQAQLITSRETYVRLVGLPADQLEPPPPLPNLPSDPTTAVAVALENNPALAASRTQRQAAGLDVRVARAGRLPRVSATAGGNYVNFLDSINSSVPGVSIRNANTAATVGVGVTLPLFQGGLPAARVRQAQARESQAIEQVTEVERSIVAQTRSAFASYQASNALISSTQAAVSAAELSLEGVRAENSVGSRTILDILNAEQELLNARVNLVSAQRNSYVAGFSLLAATGQAEARDLGLDAGTLYDPTTNYRRVRNRIWDFGSDPTPEPVATRTVDTPPQTSAVTGTLPR